MNIERIRIVEVDIGRGNGVDIERVMKENKIKRIVGVKVKDLRRKLMKRMVVKKDIVISKILRIIENKRNDVIMDDRIWRGKVRIENELVNIGIEERSMEVDIEKKGSVKMNEDEKLKRIDEG